MRGVRKRPDRIESIDGNQMRKELFAELMESMGEALEHAQGKRELRTTILPDPPRQMSALDIRRLRDSVSASQTVFAKCLNVSPQLVRAWEADRRKPEGAALRLLEVAEKHPNPIFGDLATVSQPRTMGGTRVKRAAAKVAVRRKPKS